MSSTNPTGRVEQPWHYSDSYRVSRSISHAPPPERPVWDYMDGDREMERREWENRRNRDRNEDYYWKDERDREWDDYFRRSHSRERSTDDEYHRRSKDDYYDSLDEEDYHDGRDEFYRERSPSNDDRWYRHEDSPPNAEYNQRRSHSKERSRSPHSEHHETPPPQVLSVQPQTGSAPPQDESTSRKRKRPAPDRLFKPDQPGNPYLYTYAHDYTLHSLTTFHTCRPQNNIPTFSNISDDRKKLDEKKKEHMQELRDRGELTDHIFAKKCDVTKQDIVDLQSTFDVVIIRCPDNYTLDQIASIDVDHLARSKSFLFLWVGARGVEWGTSLLAHWGFKRVEIITWAKTNRGDDEKWKDWERRNRDGVPPLPRTYCDIIPTEDDLNDPYMLFRPTVEHCLMASRGNINKHEDQHMFHGNLDNDVIVAPETTDGSLPVQIYELIDRACLGKRKIELFGNIHSLRPGWVVIGPDVPINNYTPEVYNRCFAGSLYIGTTPEIEALRPVDTKVQKKK